MLPDMLELAAKVAAARREFRNYIDEQLRLFDERRALRASRNWPTLNFVGHGRCGKDTAAEHFAAVTGLTYVGSVSKTVNPLIAWCLGITDEESYAARHTHRDYWFHWCNEFRKHDPTILVKMTLAHSDICVGTRAKPELLETVACGDIDVVVWINRLNIQADPTMEYDAGDVLKLRRWQWLDNNKDVADLQRKTECLAQVLYLH